MRIATDASTRRRRRSLVGGSGRLRIAVETFITLTRQAETATTARVSSIPESESDHEAAHRDGELDLEALVRVCGARTRLP